MIAQQTTRGLLKALQAAAASASARPGEGEHEAFVRLAADSATMRCGACALPDLLSADALCAAYRQRAAWQLLYVRRRLVRRDMVKRGVYKAR